MKTTSDDKGERGSHSAEESDDETRERDEEQDDAEDERDSDSDDDSDDDDEEEGADEAAAARPASTSVRARRRRHDHDDDAEPEVEGSSEEAGDDEEDPYWWSPYVVLAALVLFGLAGFLGLLNKTPLVKLAAPPRTAAAVTVQPSPRSTLPPNPTAATPPPRAMPTEQQPPREMFGAKHLLVMYKGGMRAPATIVRSKDEAKVRATEALKKAKTAKAKFEDLVKEYSDEPNAGQRGGDLGKFPKGAMVPQFQEALEKLKVGEISDLVETPFGFHVILRTQ